MMRIALLIACAAACQSAPAPVPASPPNASQAAPRSAGAAAVLDAADRTESDRKLDAGRKPAEMLDFLGVKPGMKVEDVGAAAGYTTELLARTVGPSGA